MPKMKYNLSRKRLETMLNKIGWRVNNSGNGLNDFIINHYGERTALRVLSDRIEFRGCEDTFGKKGCKYGPCGTISFYFKGSQIELTDKHCISIIAKGGDDVFIQLHSFKPK